MNKLLEISKWSDKMIEWQTKRPITFHDIWSMNCEGTREKIVREFIQKKGYTAKPQEFIDLLSKQERYNPLVAGAIINALIYDKNDNIPYQEIDLSRLVTPVKGIGMNAKGGSVSITGNLGYGAFENAQDVGANIQGTVQDRFAARSRNVTAFIEECIGDCLGWQSTNCFTNIRKDLIGSNAYEQSENGKIIIHEDLIGDNLGYASSRLKGRILGEVNGKGSLYGSTDSNIIFHKKPKQEIGRNATRMNLQFLEKSA